jgi:hypothetical protein
MRNDLLFSNIEVKEKSFIDIGAFDGDTCKIAISKGAGPVIGVDYLINDKLKTSGADIVPVDIFSEKWLFLPKFDVVSCQGVFYHVPDIISLFTRLRMVTGEVLFLEGHFANKEGCFMEFCAGDSLGKNHSNWWLPTEKCLHKLLQAAGFKSDTIEIYDSRIAIIAKPSTVDLRKIMPRNMKYMMLTPGSTGSKTRKEKNG